MIWICFIVMRSTSWLQGGANIPDELQAVRDLLLDKFMGANRYALPIMPPK